VIGLKHSTTERPVSGHIQAMIARPKEKLRA